MIVSSQTHFVYRGCPSLSITAEESLTVDILDVSHGEEKTEIITAACQRPNTSLHVVIGHTAATFEAFARNFDNSQFILEGSMHTSEEKRKVRVIAKQEQFSSSSSWHCSWGPHFLYEAVMLEEREKNRTIVIVAMNLEHHQNIKFLFKHALQNLSEQIISSSSTVILTGNLGLSEKEAGALIDTDCQKVRFIWAEVKA